MTTRPTQSLASSGPKERAQLLSFEEFGIADIAIVGGKNASLGEMTRHLVSNRASALPLGL